MPVEAARDVALLMDTSMLVAGAASALVAGVTGSLHCGLMCGPLACAPVPRAGRGRVGVAACWHLGRLAAYALVGAALGAVGAGVVLALTQRVQPWLPWVMAAGLVATAFDLGRHLKPLPGVGRAARLVARAGARWPPSGRAFALGATTALLPCGLLYGLFLAALATGSTVGGGLVLLAFSLGAVPALVAAQVGAQAWSRWPGAAALARRVVPLTAAALLVARALLAGDTAPGCH
jgi:sulfite exporter TauE/SafE